MMFMSRISPLAQHYILLVKLVVNWKLLDSYLTQELILMQQRIILSVQFVIYLSDDLNTLLQNNSTALHRASEMNDVELVQLLVERGASKTIRDRVCVCFKLDVECSQLFVEWQVSL